MSSLIKYRYSLVAGFFAAGGSFFGRLGHYLTTNTLFLQLIPKTGIYYELALVHTFPILLMIFCNIMNWRYFLKALQMAEQTLTATVLTACSNYMVSFLLAATIYGEPVSILSITGAAFMILGLWFLCDGGKETEKKKIN